MAYFEFPHTRTYEGDLGYILKKITELNDKYDVFFALNSIKFADPIEWSITSNYEPYTIVSDSNSGYAYISKKPVPAGVLITDTEYWEVIGSLTVDTEARQQIADLKDYIRDNIMNYINNLEYVTPEMFGAVGDGVTDDTTAIQTAINTGKPVLMNHDYLVAVYADDTAALSLKSNTSIVLNGSIKIKPNPFETYRIFEIKDLVNVAITGPGTIEGDRLTHEAALGEWGHCIDIRGSKHIDISNVSINNAWGDGIYINDSANNNTSDINISSVTCDYNSRNGISIISGTQIQITDSIFANTSRTAPMSGIDIEPNTDADIIDVFIDGCTFKNNSNFGLSIVNAHNNSLFRVNAGSLNLIDNILYISSITDVLDINIADLVLDTSSLSNMTALMTATINPLNNVTIDNYSCICGNSTTGSTLFMYSDASSPRGTVYVNNLKIIAAAFGRLIGNSANISLHVGRFINLITTVTANNFYLADLKIDKMISKDEHTNNGNPSMYVTRLVIDSDDAGTGTIQIMPLTQCYDGETVWVTNLSANTRRIQSFGASHVLPDGTIGALNVASGKSCEIKFCKLNDKWYTMMLE